MASSNETPGAACAEGSGAARVETCGGLGAVTVSHSAMRAWWPLSMPHKYSQPTLSQLCLTAELLTDDIAYGENAETTKTP